MNLYKYTKVFQFDMSTFIYYTNSLTNTKKYHFVYDVVGVKELIKFANGFENYLKIFVCTI